jgi:predicted phage replisome organizer
MSETHKYYWLKLKRDFFKRHDIVIIEAMPNGKDYILFYLKLLCESVDHEGNLRFSETIPYSEDMLATITRTNVDIVRSAVKIFSELGMMDRFDDGTLFMSQVEGMIGSETNDAIRMRIARENSKQLLTVKEKGEQCSEPFKNRSPELELDIELEKDIDKENIRAAGKPPKHKLGEFNNVLLTDAERDRLVTELGEPFFQRLITFYSAWKEEKGKVSKDDNLTIRRWVIEAVKEKEDKNVSKPSIPGRSDAMTKEEQESWGAELDSAVPATEEELAEIERLKKEALKTPAGRAIVGMLHRG